MWRTVGGICAGLVAWAVVVTILNFGLRLWLPGYVQVEHALLFTLPMKIARLVMAAITSVVAGVVVRAVAPQSRWAPWITGLVTVALFLPSHVYLWNRFPIWYHLGFLLPLAPLVVLGAQLLPRGERRNALSGGGA
ncbi:MAG TPA: hypothetical protein VMU22_05160 [Rhizomicrobium sp.]|nr:hypothetical protein [Rhizomicrobium sp.]